MNEQIYNDLVKLCDYAVQGILKFDNHKIPQDVQHLYKHSTERHKSILYSLINYTWNEKTTFLEATTDLLIKMVQQQSLPNGNKRSALLLLIIFCNNFGMKVNVSNSKEWTHILNKIAVSDYEKINQEVNLFLKNHFELWYFEHNYTNELINSQGKMFYYFNFALSYKKSIIDDDAINIQLLSTNLAKLMNELSDM